MNEKLENFERLAERRVTEAIRRLRLIGNLANKNNYSYTPAHASQIIERLDAELRMLKGRFREGGSSDVEPFSFKRK